VHFPTDEAQTLVIIGNGMVGHKLCQRMVEYGAHEEVRLVVFGEEPRPAYDRVHLSELFAGRTSTSLSLAPESWYQEHGIELYLNDPVVEVDRVRSVVRSASGVEVPYNRLVFATGSRPFVPPIDGADLPGVFVYRTIDDLYDIEDYALEVRSAAIIGGGLLGLEAAKAAHDLGLDVHVVEVAPRLMPRQLDAEGASVLRQKIEDLGVKVHCGKKLRRIEPMPAPPPAPGEDPMPGDRVLVFDNGELLSVGMVVFSAGVRPRGELGRMAGLEVAPNGGIVVDDHLQTSDPQIFAIGECATHRGITYGLVIPGYQMVDTLAANLLGAEMRFEGADQSAKLKLMGITVAALGAHDETALPDGNALVFNGGGVYRKLVVQNGRLIGAVTVGDWENLDRIRELLKAPLPLSFWDMRRFRGTGNLWPKSESAPVAEWPEEAIVCGCHEVRRGTLTMAIDAGCCTVEELGARTGAGTLCGSCKPLLSELLGEAPISVLEPMPLSRLEAQVQAQGPRSRRPEGPRSRRFDGPRSRRGGELLPASRISMLPSSSLESSSRAGFEARPVSSSTPSSLHDTPRSGRGDTLRPPPPAGDRISALDFGSSSSSRRMPITISDRPPPGAIELVTMGRAGEEDADAGPLSMRGRVLADAREDADAGPLSMRSATLSSRPSVDLPPPTLRSSLPPPPSAASLAAGLEVMQLRKSMPPRVTVSEPVPTPRSEGVRPAMLRREEEAPPTPLSTGMRPAMLQREEEAPPTPLAGLAPPRPRPAPRSASKTPAAGLVLPSLRKGEGPASRKPAPAPPAPTPPAGLKLGLSPRLPPAQPLDETPPPMARRAPVPTPPAGLKLSLRPPPVPDIPDVPGDDDLLLPAPPPTPSVLPPVEQILERVVPSSARVGTIRPPAVAMMAAGDDEDVVPDLDAMLRALPPDPPVPMLEGREPLLPETSPSAAPSSRRRSLAPGDTAEPSSRRRSLLPLESVSPSSRRRHSLEINDLADQDEPPPRDSLLMGLGEPNALGLDMAPASRRSWVPPKRLSIPPGALTVVPPPKPAIQPVPERGRKILLVASIVAVSWSLVLALVPSIPPSRSVRTGVALDALWRGSISKQVSGYGLVALAVLSLGVSLRKRWKRFQVADVPVWRAAHAALGALTLLLLFLHTGLRAGARLNLVLMIDFLAVAVAGAVAGLVTALSDRWSPIQARDRRTRSAWLHLLLTWPLPMLVVMHVVAVYYFR
jgi:nitrite reductase (NADH) large subunit